MRKRWHRGLPIINPGAVDAYLARDLDSHDWVKDVPRDEMRDHVYGLGHRFAIDPWEHQLACFSIAAALPHFLFFLKMGGGKTSLFLNQVRYRKKRREIKRAIALVPYLLHVHSWEDQIRTHAPDLSYQLLIGDKGEREALLRNKVDVCVMNYKGLEVYMSERKKVKRKWQQVLNKEKAGEFASMWDMVGYDESHRLGGHDSLLHEMCWWISCGAPFRYAFSGSPFGRDPTRLQPQFKLIDHGETLGKTLSAFRSVFFTPEKDHWSGIKWKYKEEMTPELHRIIKHRSIVYSLREMKDMPRKISIRIPVRLRGDALAYYKRILQGVQEARGDYRSLENIFVRMRQCASGFVAMRADDSSRIEVQFKDNPKLDRLREFLLSKPDEKVLVYHEFTPSGHIIEEMLRHQKIGHAILRGGMKSPQDHYDRFLKDKSCRIFVLQNQLGSECINPQYVTRRVIFYESPVDPIIREQAEGRVERPGQSLRQFIHDLVVLGTVEVKILEYIRQGQNLSKAILSGDIEGLEHQGDEEEEG